jgi:hypothetical protein
MPFGAGVVIIRHHLIGLVDGHVGERCAIPPYDMSG